MRQGQSHRTEREKERVTVKEPVYECMSSDERVLIHKASGESPLMA